MILEAILVGALTLAITIVAVEGYLAMRDLDAEREAKRAKK